MTFDPTLQLYHYPCPCGDRFEIAIDDLRDGEEIAVCPSCSLMIRVIFEVVSWTFPCDIRKAPCGLVGWRTGHKKKRYHSLGTYHECSAPWETSARQREGISLIYMLGGSTQARARQGANGGDKGCTAGPDCRGCGVNASALRVQDRYLGPKNDKTAVMTPVADRQPWAHCKSGCRREAMIPQAARGASDCNDISQPSQMQRRGGRAWSGELVSLHVWQAVKAQLCNSRGRNGGMNAVMNAVGFR